MFTNSSELPVGPTEPWKQTMLMCTARDTCQMHRFGARVNTTWLTSFQLFHKS